MLLIISINQEQNQSLLLLLVDHLTDQYLCSIVTGLKRCDIVTD